MKTLGLALMLLAGGALCGCGARVHIHPDHGRASHAYWVKQRLYEAEKGAPRGLDSEEAALIHQGYRKRSGGGEVEGKDSPSRVLLLQEDKGGRP